MNISNIVKELIFREPFYGHLALGINRLFSKEVPTACATIRGINPEIWFNEEYCSNLTEEQQVGILQHELMHICMFHLTMLLDYDDRELFNIAADMCINQYLPDECVHESWIGLKSFPGLDNIPPFKDTDFYYNYLRENQNKSKKLQDMLQYMRGGGKTVCSHPLWGQDPETGKEISEGIAKFVQKQIEHQVKEVYENNLDKNAGNIPGYLREFIASIYTKRPPTLDWKKVIRQFNSLCAKTKIKRSRRKLNIRFPDNAAVKIKNKQRVLLCVDTSGSVSNDELELFFEQIVHMHKTGTEIDIIEADAGIGRVYSYDPRKFEKITGGGGTAFSPAIEFLAKSPKHNGLIYFTDGYPFDKQTIKHNKPVLWIITPNGSVDFDFTGRKVKMSC